MIWARARWEGAGQPGRHRRRALVRVGDSSGRNQGCNQGRNGQKNGINVTVTTKQSKFSGTPSRR